MYLGEPLQRIISQVSNPPQNAQMLDFLPMVTE